MADVHKRINEEEFFNWLSVAYGISITLDGLEDYVYSTITNLHQKIYTKLATYPNCALNCSKRERKISNWCQTCQAWQREIMSYKNYQYKTILWDKIDSADWPGSKNEMVRVFCPNFWDGKSPVTSDLSAVMTLFDNCKEFTISRGVIIGARHVRNQHFAHNNRLYTTQSMMNSCLRNLENLLMENVINVTISGQKAMQPLKELQNVGIQKLFADNKNKMIGKHFKRISETINSVIQNTDENRQAINELRSDVKILFQEVRFSRLPNIETEKHVANTKKTVGFIFVLCIIVLWLAFIGYAGYQNAKEDCISLKFNNHWEYDIDFEAYLHEHRKIVGRKWLIEKIETEIFNTSKRGLILSAEMGYGKSALVSTILCSQDASNGKNIRDMVISYHMCRFDVISTQKPAYFIRNLVGIIIERIPECGHFILSDDFAMRYLKSEAKCTEDPIGCIDYGLINPLKQLPKRPNVLVVIDALDECMVLSEGKPSVVSVLINRLNDLPKWIKFVITSRKNDYLISHFPYLKHIRLDSLKKENIKDVREYIKLNFVSPVRFSSIPGSQSYEDHEKIVSKLVKISKGSFLFVVLMLEHWSGNKYPLIDEIPSSLEQVYEKNFIRIFGNNIESFSKVRILFEILSSTQRTLTKEELFEIANIKDYDIKRNLLNLIRNELSHFLSWNGDRLRLGHMAITEIFTDEKKKNSAFYISKENGHRLFAKYFLNEPTDWAMKDISDIAHHVSESDDGVLQNVLKNRIKLLNLNDQSIREHGETLLHQVVRTVDSYKTVDLILDAIQINETNYRNTANVSAEFLAAAYGHSQSLECLLDRQFNTTFTIKPALKILQDVQFCKIIGLCGYNMLHVAAQYGHKSVVQLLLFRDKSLLFLNNSIGLNAFQLAAEQGHFEIMDMILRIDTQFADLHSLHHASENSHIEAVDLLLRYGVRDVCLRCDGSFYWLNGSMRAQAGAFQFAEDIEKVISKNSLIPVEEYFDDWRLITCETALEAAIKGGHFEIVKKLLHRKPNALHCRHYTGRTPILTAIDYNKINILKILIDSGANMNDRCKFHQIISPKKKDMLNKTESDIYFKNICPTGTTVAHLIAKRDLRDVAHYLHKNGFNEWNTLDGKNITPLHHAACHGSIGILQFLVKYINVSIYSLSGNGSSLFHSAATCNSEVSLNWLYKQNVIPQYTVDNDGRNVMQYALLSKNEDDLAKSMENIERQTVLHLLMKHRRNLPLHEDTCHFEKTALHYAAENGIFDVIHILLEPLSPSHQRKLLLKVDKNKQNVLDLAFMNLSIKNYTTYPFHSVLDFFTDPHLFLKDPSISLNEFLSSYEHTIVTLLKYIHDLEITHLYNMSKYIEIAVIKSDCHVLAVLHVYASGSFDILMHKMPTVLIDKYLNTKGGPFAPYLVLPNEPFLCNKSLRENPIHRIIMNDKNSQWLYSPSHDRVLLTLALKEKSLSFLNYCFDSEGYNILHRAVLGGHLSAVRYLIFERGMQFNLTSRNNRDIISVVVKKASYSGLNSNEYFYLKLYHFGNNKIERLIVRNNISETKNYDGTISLLLKFEEHFDLQTDIFCEEDRRHLSLIHIAAAKGLTHLVKFAYNKYGQDILKCKNIHGFTPGYLAQIFNQTGVINFMREKQITMKYPLLAAEKNFLLKLYHNFKHPFSVNSSFWKCRFLKAYPLNIRLVNKQIRCVNALVHERINTGKNEMLLDKRFTLNGMGQYVNIRFMKLIPYKYENKLFFLNSEYIKKCDSLLKQNGFGQPHRTRFSMKLHYFGFCQHMFTIRKFYSEHLTRLKYLLKNIQNLISEESALFFRILTSLKEIYVSSYVEHDYEFLNQRYRKVVAPAEKSISRVNAIYKKMLNSYTSENFEYLNIFKDNDLQMDKYANGLLQQRKIELLYQLRAMYDEQYKLTNTIGLSDFPLKQFKRGYKLT